MRLALGLFCAFLLAALVLTGCATQRDFDRHRGQVGEFIEVQANLDGMLVKWMGSVEKRIKQLQDDKAGRPIQPDPGLGPFPGELEAAAKILAAKTDAELKEIEEDLILKQRAGYPGRK